MIPNKSRRNELVAAMLAGVALAEAGPAHGQAALLDQPIAGPIPDFAAIAAADLDQLDRVYESVTPENLLGSLGWIVATR